MKRLFHHHKQYLVILLFSLFVFLISCEYEPTEKYTVSLEKPTEVPSINVDLKLMTDTINFYWSSSLKMIIDVGNLKVLTVKYFLDNIQVLGDRNGNNYSVLINLPKPGTHKFKFSIITNSGTNSLGDKLGAEGYQYDSQEWILIGNTINAQNNLEWRIDNNALSFSWSKYDGPDFKIYRLKESANGSSYDIPATIFSISSYVGEYSQFDLYIVDNDNKEHLWGTCRLNKSLPALKIGSINGKVGLVWNKSVLNDNIAEYQVFQQSDALPWTKIATLPPTDTSLAITTAINTFGPMISFYLYCVPKSYTYISNTSLFSSFLQFVRVSLPGPEFNSNYGLNSTGFYFDSHSQTLNRSILYKYSSATDRVEVVMNYVWNTNFSPNANYMITPHDSIIDLYETASRTILKSTNIKSLISNFSSISPPKIADNGICILNNNNIVYALNLLTSTIIASKSLVSAEMKISADGKYFSITKGDSLLIYQINSNSVSFLTALKKAGGVFFSLDYDFCANNPEFLYIFDNSTLYVRLCKDLSLVRSFKTGAWFYNIDYATHKVLTARDGSNWDIYNFDTGNLVQSITGLTGNQNYSLLNNNTLFRSGYKYVLAP